MYLFKSELLREAPRTAPRSYAAATYGPRYARRQPVLSATVILVGDRIALLPRPAPVAAWPGFDRAA